MAIDATDNFYRDGLITLTNGSDVATGQFTGWSVALLPLDFIRVAAGITIVKEVISDTQVKLGAPWDLPTQTGVTYTAIRWTAHTDPRNYGPRVATYLAKLQNMPEDVDAFVTTLNAAVAAIDADSQAAIAAKNAAITARDAAQGFATTASGASSTAVTAKNAAEAAYDAFDDRYLGARASPPTVDNDGAALLVGALYWSTSLNAFRAWTGSAWVDPSTQALPDKSVTLIKQADVATSVIMGRVSAGAGSQEALTPAQGRTVLGIRERLAAARTYYVATTGSDAADGLSAGTPFATIQRAWNLVVGTLDLGGQAVTISVADGTYAALNIGSGWTGGGSISLIGNNATPANAIISSAGICINTIGVFPGTLTISGFKLTSTGAGLVNHGALGMLDLRTMDYGSAPGAAITVTGDGALIGINGNYTVSGSQSYHWVAYHGGFLQLGSRTITLTGTPAFSGAFVFAGDRAGIEAISCTFSGSATGTRYSVNSNSVVQTAGAGANYFPGNAAGAASNGGLYT